MAYTLIAVVTAAASWLLWVWWTTSPSKLDMPQLQFEGDNSPARYLAETGALMKKGYKMVR